MLKSDLTIDTCPHGRVKGFCRHCNPPPDPPAVGSRWNPLNSGYDERTCRVMGIVEGYVIARYKYASPWLLHVNDWHKKFKPHCA